MRLRNDANASRSVAVAGQVARIAGVLGEPKYSDLAARIGRRWPRGINDSRHTLHSRVVELLRTRPPRVEPQARLAR